MSDTFAILGILTLLAVLSVYVRVEERIRECEKRKDRK